MTDALNDVPEKVLHDAREWLKEQRAPSPNSGQWYAFNNLRSFIASIEADASAAGIAKACHALGWHIADQYGTDDCWGVISDLNERLRRIGKRMARGE